MIFYLASGNQHKKIELSQILSCHTIKIPSDDDIVFSPEENGSSFYENSMIKAEAMFDIIKRPVISDDSGLVVDGLNGMPGIFSARFGDKEFGKKLCSKERNLYLLEMMKNLKDRCDRKARFVCCMSLYISPDCFYCVQETFEGEIAFEEQGENGFGYDPVFFIPEYEKTAACLGPEQKNAISHRGKAAAGIAAIISHLYN